VNRCRDCKHWNTEDSSNVGTPLPGEGSCDLIRGNEFKEDAPARTAFGYDLLTKADFGCTLWEQGERPVVTGL
jgi:hypothetical protein